MTQALLTKNWTITPNLRIAFVSLNGVAAWWLYQNHTKLKAAGWGVVYTCDGATGPTDVNDHADRLLVEANCGTRGATAADAQSYTVLENADGVQLLLAYQGASDDQLYISYSVAEGFVPNGTGAPTAADETQLFGGASLVDATTSLDRVMTVWTSDDARHWSMALFRAGTVVNVIGLEPVNSLCATGVLSPAYVGYRYTNVARNGGVGSPVGGVSNQQPGAGAWVGTLARVFTSGSSRVIRVGGGEIYVTNGLGFTPGGQGVGVTFSVYPALQGDVGAIPLLPLIWSGQATVDSDGVFGYPIDWWWGLSTPNTVPSPGDFLPGYDPGDDTGGAARTNWLVSLGSAMVRPWRDAAVSMEMT